VTARAVAEPRTDEPVLHIKVTGHQWWWEVEYEDTMPARRLLTANELYIPVGRYVRITTRSADVIHALWVPKLAGKRDMIPGDTSHVWLKADREGVFHGRCAEFCGHQHAHMALTVVALPEPEFDTWYEQQLQPAAPPADSLRQAGLELFVTRSCVLCHTVRGTAAGARVAPDLTHVASRMHIAAGTLPNTRGNLGGWITDPQSIKPGSRMPPTALTGTELQALLAFLEGLR
jgi:cytochrome c oxidase subunit II